MDGWIDHSADGGRGDTLEQRLVESASEHIGDERVLAVFRGQTHVSPVLVPLLAPLLLFFLVKPRTVIVTDKSLITVQESAWLQAKVTRLVSRYACGSVSIQRRRLGLKIGDDPTIFALPGSLGSLTDTIALASRPPVSTVPTA